MPTTILIVDDSETVRRELRNAIGAAGYGILEATDGQTGLRLATNEDVDLIVADLHMPVMNGLDMLERLREIHGKQGIPAILLTTESSRNLVVRAKKCGAKAWMIKPVDLEMLVRGIAACLP